MKICTKCKIEKEDLNFVFKQKEKSIRHSICKECQKTYKLKHYYDNKQAHYNRNAITEKKLRDYSNNIKSQGCAICEEKELCCLDFHHLRDKEENIARLLKGGSLKKIISEISKCIVLCSNCHRKVHAGIINTLVAQLVEHLPDTQKVVGS